MIYMAPSSPEFTAQNSAQLGSSGAGSDEPARTLEPPRFVWISQLHKKISDAVAHLGIKNAVPKTIMPDRKENVHDSVWDYFFGSGGGDADNEENVYDSAWDYFSFPECGDADNDGGNADEEDVPESDWDYFFGPGGGDADNEENVQDSAWDFFGPEGGDADNDGGNAFFGPGGVGIDNEEIVRDSAWNYFFSREFGNADHDGGNADHDGGDDGDNNGGGGDKNEKKGGGSGDDEGNGDGGDKAEGGDGEEKGMNKDCTGQLGFGNRCTYHAGYENGYPVEQLHALIMFYLFCSENMINYCSLTPPVRDVSLMISADTMQEGRT